ncbi:MAG: AAA domain-containing protein [Cytophagales bacterium]|nr:AAA domain-containing protein [Bernardetiaceae bacterium]MDW8203848.1 AAA domain-containing protein [Cytophagales bacterium]
MTNLSGTNRSLMLLRLYAGQHIDLQQLDFALDKPAFDIVRQLITGKNRIPICRFADMHDAASNRASYAIKQLYRTTQVILEEQGAENLFVGYPFLQGRLNNDTPVRCPLLFFPVRLVISHGTWELMPRHDVPVGFNKTFLLAYAHHNELPLNQTLHEWILDSPAEDTTSFLTMLYRLLESASLEVHFNTEQFCEHLQPFPSLTKKELERNTATGKLRLMPQAVLGQFPQADSYLAPDYDVLLSDEQVVDLETFFNKGIASVALREEDVVVPYEIDATQQKALLQVKSGQSLVVQGPPGTGKSQLIVNMIADAIASGKRVLVVCQKKAALDVVYRRLQEKELHYFAALVHDFQQDRPYIYANIAQQIQQVREKHEQRIDLEALQNEQQFLHLARRIVQLEYELENFREALFDESICGISAKQLYLTSSLRQQSVALPDQLRIYFQAQRAQSFLPVLQRYVAYIQHINSFGSYWRNRRSFAGKSASDQQAIRQALQQVPAQIDAVKQALIKNALTASLVQQKWEVVRRLLQATHEVTHSLMPHADCGSWEAYNQIATQWAVHSEGELPPEWHLYAAQAIEAKTALHEQQLEEVLIPHARNLLNAYLQDQQSWIGKIRWLFSSQRNKIKAWLAFYQLPFTHAGISQMLHQIDCYEKWTTAKAAMQALLPFLPYPNSFKDNWAAFVKQTIAYRHFLHSWLQFAKQWLPDVDREKVTWQQLPQQWEQLLTTLQQISTLQTLWEPLLSEWQQELLWAQPQKAFSMSEQVDELFEDLCAVDTLQAQLSNEEQVMLSALEAAAPENPENWTAIFENSWRLAWLFELEKRYPILRKASGQAMLQMAAELRQAIVQKQQLSLQIARSRAWERAFSNLEYNRLQNLVSYRDLLHQVSKKRGIWPLRKLIAVYWKELANLMPCWLVSPESASALFPMEELFDLVIFDEASQCFAERGIPAMYRGKQVVIVGDEQQLAPFDLYRPRWEEINPEEEIAPELEVESLLDLGKRYLPQVMLTGHYRSRYPELIEFSNRHFYQEKLHMLPHKNDWQPQPNAIRFVKVEGIWEGQTNRIEAETVVKMIRQQLEHFPAKSIGVITFNIHQQQLIIDLLEKSDFVVPSSLFVKNIENVQGDERDCIIFSIGYAPSASGKMQLQFGSLNQAKGENRLNVAITRAREQIFVVSSIYPQQLEVADTSNEGPKLLRAYLEYAFAISQQAAYVGTTRFAFSQWSSADMLANCLLAEYPDLRPGKPFADLIRVNAQQVPVEMIITDDSSFYCALSARDVFVYQPLHFERKGWQYRYAFSRNWWKNH